MPKKRRPTDSRAGSSFKKHMGMGEKIEVTDRRKKERKSGGRKSSLEKRKSVVLRKQG